MTNAFASVFNVYKQKQTFGPAVRAMLAAAPQPERSECSWQETSARRPEIEQTIVVQRANGRLFIGVYDEHFCQPRCVDRWTGEFVSGFDLWFAVPDCAERSAGDERGAS